MYDCIAKPTVNKNVKNVETQKHKTLRARRDCKSERAREINFDRACPAKYEQHIDDNSLNEKK